MDMNVRTQPYVTSIIRDAQWKPCAIRMCWPRHYFKFHFQEIDAIQDKITSKQLIDYCESSLELYYQTKFNKQNPKQQSIDEINRLWVLFKDNYTLEILLFSDRLETLQNQFKEEWKDFNLEKRKDKNWWRDFVVGTNYWYEHIAMPFLKDQQVYDIYQFYKQYDPNLIWFL